MGAEHRGHVALRACHLKRMKMIPKVHGEWQTVVAPRAVRQVAFIIMHEIPVIIVQLREVVV